MAHSYNYSEDVWFIYNGGFDGEVSIRKKKLDDPKGYEEIVVPADALVNIVALAYVRPRKMEKLEQATPEEVLGVDP